MNNIIDKYLPIMVNHMIFDEVFRPLENYQVMLELNKKQIMIVTDGDEKIRIYNEEYYTQKSIVDKMVKKHIIRKYLGFTENECEELSR